MKSILLRETKKIFADWGILGASQLCNKYKYSGNSFVEIGTTQL
jgi:hypothetical protein